MSLVAKGDATWPWMPVQEFRDFQAARPDDERWELVDGVPVMMTPTQLGHARIAGNIERLLSDSLDAFDPTRIALHDIGVDLGLDREVLVGLGRAAGYAPQPDVGVIAAAFDAEQRFANALHVAVEVISSTDDAWLAAIGMTWIEAKTRIYEAHPPCEAVVAVEQHRMEVRLSRRSGAAWDRTVLARPDDRLRLPTCGLDCEVGELYRGTPVWRDRVLP